MAFNLGDALKAVSYSDTGREHIEYIRLEKLEKDPNNFYQLNDIDQLAANIELCGLQQPIRVRPIEGTDRYMIVSGHRRREAIELLAKENWEKWSEIPCIVERDEASPALQQLRLIYANANTRKMSPAEVSAQAEQVEKLLYQLKEEGYEFPGRMRDHVAEAVGASKSKLARLKVIRGNLSSVWRSCFEKDLIAESTAYELAQLPEKWQAIIYGQWGLHPGSLRAGDVSTFKKRFEKVVGIQCHHGMNLCEHSVTMMEQNVKERYMSKCDKCCFDCSSLQNCGKCCPHAKAKKAEMKATAKKAELEAAEREAKRVQPYVDMARTVYARVAAARSENHVSVEQLFKAQKRFYNAFTDDNRQKDYERGVSKFTENTDLPFGYSTRASHLLAIRDVADTLKCSVDYLLGRTDVMELATKAVPESDREEKEPEYIMGAWHPVTVEPPVGVTLVLIDSGGYCDTGKYKGCGEFTMDFGDPVVLWSMFPEEKDAVTSVPSSAGWKSDTPEAYGTYAAYVQVAGAVNPMLRELLWTGDEWLMFGQKISEDVTVQCWAERPEI